MNPNQPGGIDQAAILEFLSDPANADLLAELGVYDDRQALAGQQMKRGEGLFATPGAQGANVGRTYVASSPLEHLGVAVQRGLGAMQMKDAQKQQASLVDSLRTGNIATSRAMAEAMRRAKAAQSVGTPPDPGAGPAPAGGDFYEPPSQF